MIKINESKLLGNTSFIYSNIQNTFKKIKFSETSYKNEVLKN